MQLAYIAGILQQHAFTVDIIDAYALQLDESHVLHTIEQQRPDLVIFDLADFCTTQTVPEFLRAMKQRVDAQIAGHWPIRGAVGQTAAETILRQTDFDLVIRGEPELTVLELARHLEINHDLQDVRGISFKVHDQICHTADRPLNTNLDALPFPARSLLPNHKYRGIFMKKRPFTVILGSRGCPNNCVFCVIPLIQGRHFRYRSATNIVDEIEWIVEHDGIREFHFEDPNLTLNQQRCQRICEEIIARHIDVPWSCHSRVDTVSQQTLQLMKTAGCYQIHFGVETGDPLIMRHIQKGITIPQVQRAFRLAKSCDLETHAFFMIGNMGESIYSIEKSKQLCKELQPDFASFPRTIPLYGTPFYERFMAEGNRIYKMPSTALTDESRKAYTEFYTSPRFIYNTLWKVLKEPSRMTSLIDLFRGYQKLRAREPCRHESAAMCPL
jgi:radical SAM superfamily enzyme YgiQ (UPF0313 family)